MIRHMSRALSPRYVGYAVVMLMLVFSCVTEYESYLADFVLVAPCEAWEDAGGDGSYRIQLFRATEFAESCGCSGAGCWVQVDQTVQCDSPLTVSVAFGVLPEEIGVRVEGSNGGVGTEVFTVSAAGAYPLEIRPPDASIVPAADDDSATDVSYCLGEAAGLPPHTEPVDTPTPKDESTPTPGEMPSLYDSPTPPASTVEPGVSPTPGGTPLEGGTTSSP